MRSDSIDMVLEVFNSYDININATSIEVSFALKLNSLDRCNNNIILHPYRKQISSGRYMHFYCYYKMNMKTNYRVKMYLMHLCAK